MNGIGWAVKQMGDGKNIRRAGWNGKEMFLAYVEGNDRNLPYIEMWTVQRKFVPWLCSQTDLLATDWELAE